MLGLISLVFWAYLIYLEYKQMKQSDDKCCRLFIDYILNLWNLNDIIHLSFVAILVINSLNQSKFIALDVQIVMSAVASFCICLKFFDWLRLFDRTSFYINLIGMTLMEIGFFMILLIASMLMFGLPLMLLNLNSEKGSELTARYSGFEVFNMIIHEY